MRRLGLLEGWGNYPRRHVEAEYLNVLVFEDEVEVRLGLERVGSTSLTYVWEIVKDGEVYVRGRHTVVHVDDAGSPAKLPEAIRAVLG
jgi:acyl-CoA thioesterase FadM